MLGLGRCVVVALSIVCFTTCAWTSAEVPVGAVSLADDLFVEQLDDGLWRHVSHRLYPPAPKPYPSNGLIVALADGALLVDTAWGEPETELVLDWVEANVGTVRALVVTHAHDDRMGGIRAVHARGIPSYGLAGTSALGQKQGWPPLTNTFDMRMSLAELGLAGEVFFPGRGHTTDNVVVWLEAHRTLAGSCMVRALASSIGNTDDAVVPEWAGSIAAIQSRYPTLERVVPGHGDPGGTGLLAHTRRLAEAAAAP